jgi:ABC-type multidrug transport system fused ATPase/permease subunit
MLLDADRLMEFDSTQELLKQGGLLRSLVDESAHRDLLYAMS